LTILRAELERKALDRALGTTPQPGCIRLDSDTRFNHGCELIVDVSLADCGVRSLLSGYVSRVADQPEGSEHPFEVVVTFFEREAEKLAFLLQLASSRESAAEKRSSPRLPVNLNARWRPAKTGAWIAGTIADISIGGAFVRTEVPMTVGKRALFDIEVHGLETTVQIAGKVVRAQRNGGRPGMGVQFVWRDRGGLVRLREILRRIEVPLADQPLGGIGEPNEDFDEEVETVVDNLSDIDP
jgi:Tfp pilus assembly protein PilZ